MNLSLKNRISVLTYILLFVFSTTIYAAQGVPSTLSYQGKLTDSGGNTLGGGGTNYYFKFSIWDNATPGQGNKLWPTTSPSPVTLTVRQGTFSVDIGDTDNGYPDILDYNFNTNSKIYLQVEVSGDGVSYETLAPRSTISSSAFAQVANSVNSTADSSFGTTTPFANTLISALSTNINKAVMTIKGMVGQVANLFNILDSSGNTLFTVTPSGNVGIGTANPEGNLTVYNGSGDSILTIAGSGSNRLLRVSQGLNVAAGTVDVGILSGKAGLSRSMGSSFLYYDTSTGDTVMNNVFGGSSKLKFQYGGVDKIIMDSNGNLGIGTTTPTSLLSVAGNGWFGGNITGTGNLTLSNNLTISYGSPVYNFSAIGPRGFQFNTNSVSRLFIDPNGNVGIGTANPGALLDVNGVVKISNNGGLTLSGAGTSWGSVTNGQIIKTDNTLASIAFFLSEAAGATSFRVDTGSTNLFSVKSNGNVGIGITTPSTPLDVVGAVIARYKASPSWPVDSNGYVATYVFDNGGSKVGRILPYNGSSYIDLAIGDWNSGNPNIMLKNGGNVGIGIGLPSNRLSVAGSADISGNLGIGTTTPSQKLSVVGNAQITGVTSGTYAFDLNLTSDGTLTTSASDINLKQNIMILNSSSTLEKLSKLKPSSFDWKSNNSHDIGLIAQEVEEIFPELVFTNPTDGYKGINYSRFITLLISSVQELTNKMAGFAREFKSDKIETKMLCVEDVCVTKDQLQNLLQNNNVAPVINVSTDQSPSTEEIVTEDNQSTTTEEVVVSDDQSTSTEEEVVNDNPAPVVVVTEDIVQNTEPLTE